MRTDDSFDSFFRSFSRPIYAHVWIWWLCITFLLIGWSESRLLPDGGVKVSKLVWLGGVGFMIDFVALVASLRYSDVRRELIAPTRRQVRGALPRMLKFLAVFQAIAVIVVWMQ